MTKQSQRSDIDLTHWIAGFAAGLLVVVISLYRNAEYSRSELQVYQSDSLYRQATIRTTIDTAELRRVLAGIDRDSMTTSASVNMILQTLDSGRRYSVSSGALAVNSRASRSNLSYASVYVVTDEPGATLYVRRLSAAPLKYSANGVAVQETKVGAIPAEGIVFEGLEMAYVLRAVGKYRVDERVVRLRAARVDTVRFALARQGRDR